MAVKNFSFFLRTEVRHFDPWAMSVVVPWNLLHGPVACHIPYHTYIVPSFSGTRHKSQLDRWPGELCLPQYSPRLIYPQNAPAGNRFHRSVASTTPDRQNDTPQNFSLIRNWGRFYPPSFGQMFSMGTGLRR